MGSGQKIQNGIFTIRKILALPEEESVERCCYFENEMLDAFAVSLSKTKAILLFYRGDPRKPYSLIDSPWTIKHIPWFENQEMKITAMHYNNDGTLFMGTQAGNLFELKTLYIIDVALPRTNPDIKELFQLSDSAINGVNVWNRGNTRIILCYGNDGKFAILPSNSSPVLVTFVSSIISTEIFLNKMGLICILVSLGNGQNVYAALEDLELPSTNQENSTKRSLFRKAKDNFLSRLVDDKTHHFFAKRSSKEPLPNSTGANPPSVVAAASVNNPSLPKPTSIPPNNMKFNVIEEPNCQGRLEKISDHPTFVRHYLNKLDTFDEDFRQTSTIFVPSFIQKLFIFESMHYGLDIENKCLRVHLVHNGMLKEFTKIPLNDAIISMKLKGFKNVVGLARCSYVIGFNGIYEISLKSSPLDTCVELLVNDTPVTLLDSVCDAFGVSKSDVYIMAADMKAEEGKFSNTIVYYKLAGLSYSKICAKFGAKKQIPAMLLFYELVEKQKAKPGSNQDREAMSNLVLLGRIEQYLRHGRGTISNENQQRDHRSLLINHLKENTFFSSRRAAQNLRIPELVWSLIFVGKNRLCYPEIIESLFARYQDLNDPFLNKDAFWRFVSADWLTLYSLHPKVFLWVARVVSSRISGLDEVYVYKLLHILVPWRRELQMKLASEGSATNVEHSNLTLDDSGASISEYIELFIVVLLEILRRESNHIGEAKSSQALPSYFYQPKSRYLQMKLITENTQNHTGALLLLHQMTQTFSASSAHCLCVRNGKIYCWGENKFGRLGAKEELLKAFVDSPIPVNLSSSLKLSINSVSCGQNHNLALTSVGTILVWGSNQYGQLGVGEVVNFVSRPIALDLQKHIFISVSAGSYHSAAIDSNYCLWLWGWGIHGQLGAGDIENASVPRRLKFSEKIVQVSCGHSHTCILTVSSNVYVTGCNHFGQLGLGSGKMKTSRFTALVSIPPTGSVIRYISCGSASTVMVTNRNRLYYMGINPSTLKSFLSSRRQEKGQESKAQKEEEKDYTSPILIDTRHVTGEISKVNIAVTHFIVLTSLGHVYTWGVGKSGQLARTDDDCKTLELIDDDRGILVSDVFCAGDATFIIEREFGTVYGCGFNSCGQLGKLETCDEPSVMTIRTKRKILKVRQPANIFFKLKEIPNLPRQVSKQEDNTTTETISPPSSIINQDLLHWVLQRFRKNYDHEAVLNQCIQNQNYPAASLLESMAGRRETSLRHDLAAAGKNVDGCVTAVEGYVTSSHGKQVTPDQAFAFLTVVIEHWNQQKLPASVFETLIEKHRSSEIWEGPINLAIRDIVAAADSSGEWLASNMTPLFILSTMKYLHSFRPPGHLPPPQFRRSSDSPSSSPRVNDNRKDLTFKFNSTSLLLSPKNEKESNNQGASCQYNDNLLINQINK